MSQTEDWKNRTEEQIRESQLLFEIQGQGGTGKSKIIDFIVNMIGPGVFVSAFSGCAAVNVKGQTVCSGFGIQPRFTTIYKVLLDDKLAKLQQRFKNVN